MKFITSILIVHILLSTIAPAMPIVLALVSTQHLEGDCCSKEITQKLPVKNQNKNCCNDFCNAFMSCCNGYALLVNLQVVDSKESSSTLTYNRLIQNTDSNFLSEPWHPPKCV